VKLETIPINSHPIPIRFSDVGKSALLTLYCRALESQAINPILIDEKAVEITRKLTPYLATMTDKLSRSLVSGKVNRNLIIHIALRSQQYDCYARGFLNKFPKGMLINMGCGMDTRYFRLDNGQALFFDLDLPEMIEFKKQFIGEGERYRFLPASVFDYGWMEAVAGQGKRPAMFMAEGVFMYLQADKVRELVLELQSRFSGSELVCEVVNALWVREPWNKLVQRKMQRSASLGAEARYHFGISGSRDLEQWHAGIEFLEEWVYFDASHPKLGWLRRLRNIGLLRHTQWTVHYRLN
jgi:methyltransferase (TIGR00027 family)